MPQAPNTLVNSAQFPILTLYSESHQKLYEVFFKGTFPYPERILATKVELSPEGKYSEQRQIAISQKPQLVTKFIRSVPAGTVFVYSDSDVQFLPAFSTGALLELFQSSKVDLMFQKNRSGPEDPEVCTGFWIARTSPRLLEFFERVIIRVGEQGRKSDQYAINSLLGVSDVAWTYLPLNYYARTHGFPPPRDACIHHATETGKGGPDEKFRQLTRIHQMFHGGFLSWCKGLTLEAADYVTDGRLVRRLRWEVYERAKTVGSNINATSSR